MSKFFLIRKEDEWSLPLPGGAEKKANRQWPEINAHEVTPAYEAELYCVSHQALNRLLRRGCGVSLTGNIPEPSGCNPKQCAPGLRITKPEHVLSQIFLVKTGKF